MKKILSALLAFSICISLCACGQTKCTQDGCKEAAVEDVDYGTTLCETHLAKRKAFDLSQLAYTKINNAYGITDTYCADIYEAWRLGIFEKKAIEKDAWSTLANELSLTEDELSDAFVYLTYVEMAGSEWDDVDPDIIQNVRNEPTVLYAFAKALAKDDLYSFCVQIVRCAYIMNGKADEAQALLEDAKALMKTMSDKYSDYEFYPALKGYYTTTTSFFDFCKNPTGSFEQLKSTLEDYRNTARDYKADLDFIFE